MSEKERAMSDPREALVALLAQEFGQFLAHSPHDPQRFYGTAADAILAEFDVTPRGEGEPDRAYAEGRWCGECRYGVVEDPPCCTPAPAVPDNPHGMWCPPGCGHDRSEAAVPDVVRELDAVMHHHADRADAAEAEADRLARVVLALSERHCQTCTCGCTCGFGGEHVEDNPRCALTTKEADDDR